MLNEWTRPIEYLESDRSDVWACMCLSKVDVVVVVERNERVYIGNDGTVRKQSQEPGNQKYLDIKST